MDQSSSIISLQGFWDENAPPLLVLELARLRRARGRGATGLHQGHSADDQTPEQLPAGRALQVGLFWSWNFHWNEAKHYLREVVISLMMNALLPNHQLSHICYYPWLAIIAMATMAHSQNERSSSQSSNSWLQCLPRPVLESGEREPTSFWIEPFTSWTGTLSSTSSAWSRKWGSTGAGWFRRRSVFASSWR